MPSPISQAAFVGGELAPSLHGRVDLARYTQSAERIENFVVDPHGGATFRQGSRFVSYTKYQAPHELAGMQVRLIPFEPSSFESYVLEFGHEYLRIHTQYGPVFTTAFPLILSNDEPESVPLITTKPLLAGQIKQAQSFLVPAGGMVVQRFGVRMAKADSPSGLPPQLRGAIHTDVAFVPSLAPVAGASFTDFQAPDPADLVPGSGFPQFVYFTLPAPVTLPPGNYHFVVESDPGSPFNAICMTNDHRYPSPTAPLYWNGMAWSTWPELAALDWCFSLHGPDAQLFEVATPYQSLPFDDLGTESELTQLVVTQSVDLMTIVHRNHVAHELIRYGEGSWTFLPLRLEPAPGTPTNVSFAPVDGGTIPPGTPTKMWGYAVSGVSRDGIESAPFITPETAIGPFTDTDPFVRMIITPSVPVDHFAVYKGRNGTYGFVGITKMHPDLTELWDYTYAQAYADKYEELRTLNHGGHGGGSRPEGYDARDDDQVIAAQANAYAREQADAAVAAAVGGGDKFAFDDENIAPDYTDQPRRFINPFASPDGSDTAERQPAVTTYHQQRQVFANWQGKPDTLALSETGDYKNFQRSIPTVDDDSIEATLAAGQLNSVRALVAMRDLYVFTSGAEFVVRADRGPLTPSNIDALPVSRRGSGTLQPLVIGNVIIFADRAGRIREWLYQQDSNDYPATDVGLLAAHLFDNYAITAWTYVTAPRSVVWATRTDGLLLTFTYVREQSVAAWARHSTLNGKFRSICSIREFGERDDTIWTVVQRSIAGTEYTIIEKFPPRSPLTSVFLDCYSQTVPIGPGVLSITTGYPGGDPGTIVGGVLTGVSGTNKGEWIYCNTPNYMVIEVGQYMQFRRGPHVCLGRVVRIDTAHLFWMELMQDIPEDFLPVFFTMQEGDWNYASTVWGGFSHLAGETVGVVADGGVRPDVVVAMDGTITLDAPAIQVAVGLHYTGTIKLLPLVSGGSEIRSKMKIVSSIDLDVKDTRGIWVGESESFMTEKKPVYPGPTQLQQARITCRSSSTWGKSGAQVIQQRDPVPCTVLGVTPEVTVGG